MLVVSSVLASLLENQGVVLCPMFSVFPGVDWRLARVFVIGPVDHIIFFVIP